MATYSCPNPNAPMSLTAVLALLDADSGFATFLAIKVQAANDGDQEAINCVDSYSGAHGPRNSKFGNTQVPGWAHVQMH